MSFLVLADDPARPDCAVVQEVTDGGEAASRIVVASSDLPALVAAREAARPRWVWDDTARWYPPLLAVGVRVERCHDLRLCHAIVRRSASCARSGLALAPPGPWDGARPGEASPAALTLFDDPTAPTPPVVGDDDVLAGRPEVQVRGGRGGQAVADLADERDHGVAARAGGRADHGDVVVALAGARDECGRCRWGRADRRVRPGQGGLGVEQGSQDGDVARARGRRATA